MGYSLFFKWLIWLLIVQTYRSKGCIQKEKIALLHIRKIFNSMSFLPNVHLLSSWNEKTTKNCCLWERVKCDRLSGHITKLSLGSLLDPNYDCMVPTTRSTKVLPINMSIFHDLEALQSLTLSLNCITNVVGDEGLCNLKNLKLLDFSENRLSGSIPNCISNMSSLQHLYLGYNRFSGSIKGLCTLKELQTLQLAVNNFKESVPICIYKLSALQNISLEFNSFEGNISSEICNMKKLQLLSLSYNRLSGNFPTCIGNLSYMKFLELSHNEFSGGIEEGVCKLRNIEELSMGHYLEKSIFPICVGNLTSLSTLRVVGYNFTGSISYTGSLINLKYLDLSFSQLVGPAISTISNCTKLEELYMSDNSLEGKFSLSQLSKLSNLLVLELVGNKFEVETEDSHWIPSFQLQNLLFRNSNLNKKTRTFPTFLSYQYHLESVVLSNNNLVGLFPTSSLQGSMKQITFLDLSHNYFEGELPEKLFSSFYNLEAIILSNNNFHGKLISKSMNLPHLHTLIWDNNLFSGIIEDSLLKSTYLEIFDISFNQVSGELPSWLGNFHKLQILSIQRNLLHGEISSAVCNNSLLTFLDLSSNQFNGRIPSCIGTMFLLQYLYLNNNNLSGHIPHELSTASNLVVLDLRDNQLTRDIWLWIGWLSNLTILLLSNNKLRGELPSQLCHLQRLNVLDIANNEISGTIPPCLKSLSFGSWLSSGTTGISDGHEEHLDFITKGRYCSYVGKRIYMMSGLDLSCNRLSGHIPKELGYLKNLHSLNLSHNKLNGLLPETFSLLSSIESMDLSSNNLSGHIPSQLIQLNFLEVFNVSFNNLSGRVPTRGQFGTFDATHYEGNHFLYGFVENTSSIAHKTPNGEDTREEDRANVKFDWRIFFWSFGPSCLIFLMSSIMVVFNNPRWLNSCFIFINAYTCWYIPLY